MNILLTGATGFLGFRILEKLIEIKEVESIIASGRNLRENREIKHPKLSYILGDLSNPSLTDEIAPKVDTVINAAALSSPWGTYEEFEKSNIQTQTNLINSSKAHNIRRFIYISSPSIYFDYTDKFNIKETDHLPLKFVNAYAESKYKAEVLIEASGIPFITLRPRAIIGRGDTVIMPRLINAFKENRLKIIGTGENIVDLSSVSNVVDAVILSLFAKKEALNESYNISNGKPINLWETIDYTLSRLGMTLSNKKVPFNLVKSYAQLLEIWSTLISNKEPTLTKYGVGTLAKSFTMDISKAKNKLGYEPQMDTLKAIDEFTKWYMDNEES